MHTEQEKFDAALAAMAKAGWPVEYHNGEPLLLSEGNLGVDCFNAGYDFAAATPTPASSVLVGEGAENPVRVVLEVLNDWLEENEATDFDEHDVAHLFGMLGTAGYSIVPNALATRPAPLSLLGSGDAPADWVIVCRKQGRGLPYWRPNQAGYTESVVDAGKCTHAEADAICETCKGDAEAYVIGDPTLYTLISNENLARGKEIKLWLENRDLRAALSASASTDGGAGESWMPAIMKELSDAMAARPDTNAPTCISTGAAFVLYNYLKKLPAAAPQHLVVAGAVPDELLSAYCDLAASHEDALPITASTDGEGLVMLYHNDGTSIEADQRLADFVAAACNAAGAGFRKDLAAFGREDAAPQHLVVGEAAGANYKGLTEFYIVEGGLVKSYQYVAQCKAENYHILKEQGSELPRRVRYDELDRACSTEQGAWAMLALALEDDMLHIKNTILPQFGQPASPTDEAR